MAAVLAGSSAGAADPAVIAKGELVFHIGGCTNCHTAKGGQLLAGGDPLQTPFGTFHPPNITPDPKTGIGGWNCAADPASYRRRTSNKRAPQATTPSAPINGTTSFEKRNS